MKKSSRVTLTILAGLGCTAYAQQQPPPSTAPANPPVNCGKSTPQTPTAPCPVTRAGFGGHGAAVQAHAAS